MFSKINSIWSPVLPNLVGVEVNKTSCFWRKYDMESSHPQPCGGNMTIFWGVKQYGGAGGAKPGVKQKRRSSTVEERRNREVRTTTEVARQRAATV